MINTLEHKLTDALLEPINGLGYILWGVEIRSDKYAKTACVYIDKEDGITVDDCSNVIMYIKTILNLDDLLPDDFLIEVSSPGLDRLLFTKEQYEMYLGEDLLITLFSPLAGKRKLKGKLLTVQDNGIQVELNKKEQVSIEFSNIKKANIEPKF